MYKIAYYSASGSDLSLLSNAINKYMNEHDKNLEIMVKGRQELSNKSDVQEFINYTAHANLLIIYMHGGKESCPVFDKLINILPSGSNVYIQPCNNPIEIEISLKYSNVERNTWKKLFEYFTYGGLDNFYNMFIFLSNTFCNSNYPLKEPQELPWEGIYVPGIPRTLSLREYLDKKYRPGHPTVGIWFHRIHWLNQDFKYIDSIIEAVEREGANAVAVFRNSRKDKETGNLGAKEVIEKFFVEDGKVIIDVLINMMMFSATMMDSENRCIFERLNVPVIKGILSGNKKEEWENSFQGLTPVDVSISVALPEFDGNLIGVPAAFNDILLIDFLTGAKITRYIPETERINRLIRLSLNWAKLRIKSNKEKKIAILFHNYPPRNDNIGTAFGLDSPASVINILKEMKKRGFETGEIPKSGQELMENMLSYATNDRSLTSIEKLHEKSLTTVGKEEYRTWFERIPEKVRFEMINSWIEIPGEILNLDDKLIIPGMISGNVFIGIQPPRGFLEDSYVDVHDSFLPFPHHYYAYYEWIRNSFMADAIMHIGMHGTLEWLPGKSVGLSGSCYPELAIGDLPNIYPYIINNPSEGTQAKRRSNCCIIDHMIPVMQSADIYDEMAELEKQMEDYYEAKVSNINKLNYLKDIIWEKFIESNLNEDLNIHDIPSDFDLFLEKVHGYLSEIKDTQIREGLHTFGEVPEGQSMIEFLVALTRLENCDAPSLRKSVADMMGYELDLLLDNRGKLNNNGKTNAKIIDEIHEVSIKIVAEYAKENFNTEKTEHICKYLFGKKHEGIEKSLLFIGETLVPKLRETVSETVNSVNALEGKFVPAGPSGSPTRGMAHILPTGRNFYSVDPQTIPTMSAWKVGENLANDMLNRYLSEEGCYPESVGIVIFGNGTMRTKGDDISEILYLMGVRPIWSKENMYVKDIEVISIKELKRPRIDITLRISGFFRDAFPNIIKLIDDAIQMVAFLDEPDDKNYISKHVKEEISDMISKGKEIETAREEACYRIFGSKPGTYGAGVNNLINTKNWNDVNDLGDVFISWGSFVYSAKNYGKSATEVFKNRLSKLDVAVKNIDSKERGIMDSDDFYSFYGGMIAAVKTHSGKNPKSFIGDSSEIDRIKTKTLAEETKHELRARVLNPKWIESMKKHGYKGAGDISVTVDYAFGWDATAEVIDDWMYENLAERFVLDENFTRWVKNVNPWALKNIAEKLLEAVQRGMWDADEEMHDKIKHVYLSIEGDIEGYDDYI